MHWYSHLYVGKKAEEKRFQMMQKIRFHRPQAGTYVITPASNGNNLLDIYPSMVLLQPYYKKKDLLIMGLAADYFEALDVAGQIVTDLYRKTGGFDLSAMLEGDRA